MLEKKIMDGSETRVESERTLKKVTNIMRTKNDKMSIEEKKSIAWIWLYNNNIENPQEVYSRISGKYLFFSKEKSRLIEIAKEILVKYGLYVAKVPRATKILNGGDFVLCVYDSEDKYKDALAKYGDDEVVHYRYWKRGG